MLEKERERRIKAKNKIEAEIHFKKWKINKDRQIAEEKKKKKIEKELKKQEEIEQKYLRYRGETLLAYSNLSN